MSILLTHPLCHTKNAYLVISNRLCDINTEKFCKAFKLLDNCMRTLCKFKCGTGTIPSCPLLQATKAKQARSKQDKTNK